MACAVRLPLQEESGCCDRGLREAAAVCSTGQADSPGVFDGDGSDEHVRRLRAAMWGLGGRNQLARHDFFGVILEHAGLDRFQNCLPG